MKAYTQKIWELKELDTSYNTASTKYINDKFNETTIEDMLQEKALIHQEHTYFSVMLSEYGKPQNFQK